MTRTFFCVNTSRPQLLASASALRHVSRRCCVGMAPSADLPPCLSQVKVVPSRCSCTVCARSPEAHHAPSAPRVDELKLFRVKNNRQGVMKIKTASPCFGQINTGVMTNGTGRNHGSSQGGLPLPGGVQGGTSAPQAVPRGQPQGLSPVPLQGHPCAHCDAAPATEMALGTQSCFLDGTGHCRAVPGVQEERPVLLVDQKQILPFLYHSGTFFFLFS